MALTSLLSKRIRMNPLYRPSALSLQSRSEITLANTKLMNHSFQCFCLTFLGSGGSSISRYRGQPSLHLKLDSDGWLFDCGASTLSKTPHTFCPSFAAINKIFITHLHADHIGGLLPIVVYICSSKSVLPLEIYGPVGLHQIISPALRVSRSGLLRNIIIHELEIEPRNTQSQNFSWRSNASEFNYPTDPYFKNNILRTGGSSIELKHIKSDSNHVWDLVSDPRVSVKAKLIPHRIPCFGFVIKESPKAGSLQASKLIEMGLSNLQFRTIKLGQDVTLSDGTLVKSSDYLNPPIPGRKICILGDTSDASSLSEEAKDCDLLVHEATFSNEEELSAVKKGHSTPSIAGKTALLFGAKRLVLNHIGAQYLPAYSTPAQYPKHLNQPAPSNLDSRIYKEAVNSFGRSNHLVLAKDMLQVYIPEGGFNSINNNNNHTLNNNNNINNHHNNNNSLKKNQPLSDLKDERDGDQFDWKYTRESNPMFEAFEYAYKDDIEREIELSSVSGPSEQVESESENERERERMREGEEIKEIGKKNRNHFVPPISPPPSDSSSTPQYKPRINPVRSNTFKKNF